MFGPAHIKLSGEKKEASRDFERARVLGVDAEEYYTEKHMGNLTNEP
jgi:hypothetical protein